MQVRARLAAWSGQYPRMLWLLAFGSFLNIGGLSFLWPLTTVYMHNHLGKPMTAAGLVLFFHSGGAALGQLAGGWLYDRIGARPVMLAGLLSSALLTGLLGLFESWPLYVTVMIGFGFTASLPGPAINALVARAWPGGGRRAFNFVYVANNLGVAAGTALGGILADRSFSLAFLAASATFLLFAVFVLAAIHERGFAAGDGPAGISYEAEVERARHGPIPWAPILALFAANLTLWMIYVQWQSAVSVHMGEVGFDTPAYSALWTLNGLLIFLGQPLLALLVRLIRGSAGQMALGAVLYAGAFGLLLTSGRYATFVASMVVLTFGEMLLWPVIPSVTARLSPPAARGRLQGLVLSGATFGRMAGPLAGGVLYDRFGFAALMIATMAGLVVPLAAILLYHRTRPAEKAAPPASRRRLHAAGR